MKKLLASLLLLVSSLAIAQSYPSPTFQNLTVLGTFTGTANLSNLAAQAANTVVANVTASSASPTAVALPSCSTSSSALLYTSASGFTCNTSVNAATLGGKTFASPGNIGTGAASEGVFAPLFAQGTTGTALNVSTSGSSAGMVVADSGSSGANIELTGNGATTPSKWIQVSSGQFHIVNNAYTTVIFSLDDTGDLTLPGYLSPSQTAGIIGTTTNNNANAGSVGEYQPVTGSSNAISNGITTNITSINLTAGDWDVSGVMSWTPTGVTTNSYAGISTTSGSFSALGSYIVVPGQSATGATGVIATPVWRVSIATTTTVYLIGNVSFSGTCTAQGFIRARRVR